MAMKGHKLQIEQLHTLGISSMGLCLAPWPIQHEMVDYLYNIKTEQKYVLDLVSDLYSMVYVAAMFSELHLVTLT